VRSRRAAWIRWILLSEGLILLFAVAGPGYRHSVGRRGDHGLFARWFIDDSGFFESVLVNLVVFHVFIAAVWLAARITSRAQQRR